MLGNLPGLWGSFLLPRLEPRGSGNHVFLSTFSRFPMAGVRVIPGLDVALEQHLSQHDFGLYL